MDLDDDDTEGEEDGDPNGAGNKAEFDRHVAFNAPTSAHDVSHGLTGTSTREIPKMEDPFRFQIV